MKRVVLVVGTRPEVIKMAPIYRELQQSKKLQPFLLSTGQHREMLAQALSAFDLIPDQDLGLMQPGQTLPDLTARVLQAVTQFLNEESPAALLVQGDTTTVLAAAMAAAFAHVPIGHVEAGLRTYNMNHPFPEEMNRRLVSPLARWSFVPTNCSRDNLLSERIAESAIHVTGNSVIDALLWVRDKTEQAGWTTVEVARRLAIPQPFQRTFLEGGKKWILVTGHRRESFGDGFESICRALLQIAEEHRAFAKLFAS